MRKDLRVNRRNTAIRWLRTLRARRRTHATMVAAAAWYERRRKALAWYERRRALTPDAY